MCEQHIFCYAWSLRVGAKAAAKFSTIHIILQVTAIIVYVLYPYIDFPETELNIISITKNVNLAVSGAYLAVSIISVIGLVYLILGILQERPEFILIWLFVGVVQIVASTTISSFFILAGDIVSILILFVSLILVPI
uniref:Uncharacterized protein n=1 Tax=Strigamia maritima TaxID=126957 RepID=T1J9M6_STRMM